MTNNNGQKIQSLKTHAEKCQQSRGKSSGALADFYKLEIKRTLAKIESLTLGGK